MVIKTASPGIIVNEVDLTRGTSDAISTNVGAIVGPFQRGPVDELVLIETEAELQRVFGDPTDYNFEYWYTVANFLEYGGIIYVVRVDDLSGGDQKMRNAASGVTDPSANTIYIKNEEDFDENYLLSSSLNVPFVAQNPGTWADGLGIAVIDAGADYQFSLLGTAGSKKVQSVTAGTAAPDAATVFGTSVTANSIVGRYTQVAATNAADPAIAVGDFVYQIQDGGSADPATQAAGYVEAYANGIFTICQVTTVNFVYTPASGTRLAASGTSAQSGVISAIEAVGNYTLYGYEAADPSKINVFWNPASKTSAEGQVYGWPAVPRVGAQKKLTAVGLTYEWSELDQVWYVVDSPTDGVDMIYNGTYVFTVEVAESWYDQQIAFAGIPWARFASRPGTTLNAAERGAKNDEMNLIIYDALGDFTGSKGNTLLQLPGISKGRGVLTTLGADAFYVHDVNTFSNYVYASGATMITPIAGDLNTGKEAVGTLCKDGVDYVYISPASYVLGGGVDQLVASLGERQIGYDKFTKEEVTDLDYILQGPSEGNEADSVALANFIISIAEERRDCMAFISPPRADVVGQTDSERITTNLEDYYDQLTSSSYTVFDSGYKYTYDRYNDTYRYVPLNADVAGCLVRATFLAEPWYSPAGLARGQILNVVKLPYNPSKKQRDVLYTNRCNPVVTFPGEGTILFGDKTALAYSSAFDRINVRKLFLIVEKEIAKISRTTLFEFNDEITRSLFKNNVNPFLRDIQARRGIFDFLVVCDETNNTPEIIDRNEFIADIYIKPARSINFITLNFIATKTGVSFDESIALFRRPNA